MTDLDRSIYNYLEKTAAGKNIFTSIAGSLGTLGRNIKGMGQSVYESKGLFGGVIDKAISGQAAKAPQNLQGVATTLADMVNNARKKAFQFEQQNAGFGQRFINTITGTSKAERAAAKAFYKTRKGITSSVNQALNEFSTHPTDYLQNPKKLLELGSDVIHMGRGNRLTAEALPSLAAARPSIMGKNKRVARELLKNTTNSTSRNQLKTIIERDTKRQLAVGGTATVGIGGTVAYKANEAGKQKEALNQQLKQYYMQNSRIRM